MENGDTDDAPNIIMSKEMVQGEKDETLSANNPHEKNLLDSLKTEAGLSEIRSTLSTNSEQGGTKLQEKNSKNLLLNEQAIDSGILDNNSHDFQAKSSESMNSISDQIGHSTLTSTSTVNGDSGINDDNVRLVKENDNGSNEHIPIITVANEGTEDEDDSFWPSTDDESEGSGSESDLEDNVDDSFETHRNAIAKFHTRDPNPELPETVTTLTTPDGGKVYLVGTAHFSVESQEDVSKTIQATQPDVVMVELCKSRVNILSLDEKTILEETKNMNFEKIRFAIKQSGIVQGVMYLLLLTMSAHLTRELGMAPGGEFRRAFTEAKKVSGCLIHLGDRPIHITLQRAISALSWWQKVRLAWYILTSREPISKEEVERCKQRDLLEEMLAEMTGEFPALSTVFLKERDIYLAYSLRLAAMPIHTRSNPEGIIPAVVVGVVGMGHVPGIVENWEKVTEKDIPPILKIPEPSLTSKVLRKTFKYSLLGLALWGCYRLLPQSVTSSLSPQRSFEWISKLLRR